MGMMGQSPMLQEGPKAWSLGQLPIWLTGHRKK